MKKIKLITSLSTVVALGGVSTVVASCSCSNTNEQDFTIKLVSNEVPLDEEYELYFIVLDNNGNEINIKRITSFLLDLPNIWTTYIKAINETITVSSVFAINLWISLYRKFKNCIIALYWQMMDIIFAHTFEYIKIWKKLN